jgi:hypothetical protein
MSPKVRGSLTTNRLLSQTGSWNWRSGRSRSRISISVCSPVPRVELRHCGRRMTSLVTPGQSGVTPFDLPFKEIWLVDTEYNGGAGDAPVAGDIYNHGNLGGQRFKSFGARHSRTQEKTGAAHIGLVVIPQQSDYSDIAWRSSKEQSRSCLEQIHASVDLLILRICG